MEYLRAAGVKETHSFGDVTHNLEDVISINNNSMIVQKIVKGL